MPALATPWMQVSFGAVDADTLRIARYGFFATMLAYFIAPLR